MARKIMRSLKIKEISGVDRPAQQGAKAVIIKRADGDPVEEFAKVSFRAAFDETMFNRKFCDVFYAAFDGVWAANDAFQTALKDAYQSSEQTVAEYTQAIAEMAQRAADAVDGLRKAETRDAVIKAAVEQAVEDFLESQEENDMAKYTTKAALKAAIAKFAKDGGTDQEITDIKDSAVSLSAQSELPATGALAIVPDNSGELSTLKRQVSILSLGGDARKHFDGLDTAGQDAFLALDTNGQTEAINKAAEAAKGDPVLYTTKDGIEIRKSDGATALLMAKNFDKINERLTKMETSTVGESLKKRAAREFPNLPQDSTVDTLEMIEKADDEDKKKRMLELLRSANKSAGGAFRRFGHQGNGGGAGGSVTKGEGVSDSQFDDGNGGGNPDDAANRLDAIAKGIQERDGISYSKAYVKAMETPEAAEIYKSVVQDERFPAED